MNLEFFSRADWLNKERLTVYPRIFVVLYVVTVVLVLSLSHNLIAPNGKNVGTDFMNVWAAGKMALDGRASEAYDYQKHLEVQRGALPWNENQRVPYYGWHYPPMFLMAAACLAFLPYGWALMVWMVATLPAYLAAIRTILPGHAALMAALAFPGVLVNLGHGQNGFVTAGLFGGGLLLLEKRPYVAGLFFGLLAYKPQFGVLIPLALLAGGHWRAIAAAAITLAATVAASYMLFGFATWQAFFQSLELTRIVVLERGSTGWERIQSVFSAVRLLGGSIEAAYVMQFACGIFAALTVIWIWRSGAAAYLKNAALVVGCLMVTPYILDYDLIVLALPIAWLTFGGMKNGFLPWEKIILLATWILPLFVRVLAKYLYLPVAPLVMAGLLLIILRCVRKASFKPT